MPQKSTFSNTIPHNTNLPELNRLILKAYNTVIYARSRPKKETTRQYGGKSTGQAVAKRLRHCIENSLLLPKTHLPLHKKSLNAPPSPPPFFNVDTLV